MITKIYKNKETKMTIEFIPYADGCLEVIIHKNGRYWCYCMSGDEYSDFKVWLESLEKTRKVCSRCGRVDANGVMVSATECLCLKCIEFGGVG